MVWSHGNFCSKRELSFFFSGGEESSSLHQVFCCCCSCGSIVKEMIPIVIQKYHCSAFNSILFSEMIKTWQTQTDRQSFFFIWSTKKCIFQKCNTFLCYSLPSCLLLPRKKVSRINFQKNFKSILSRNHASWGLKMHLWNVPAKQEKVKVCMHGNSYLVAVRPTTLSNSSFAKRPALPTNQPHYLVNDL